MKKLIILLTAFLFFSCEGPLYAGGSDFTGAALYHELQRPTDEYLLGVTHGQVTGIFVVLKLRNEICPKDPLTTVNLLAVIGNSISKNYNLYKDQDSHAVMMTVYLTTWPCE